MSSLCLVYNMFAYPRLWIFSSNSFVFLVRKFRFNPHLELFVPPWCRNGSRLFSHTGKWLNHFGKFDKNQFTIYACYYFWILFPVLLVSLSILLYVSVCQRHIIFITVTLQRILKSGSKRFTTMIIIWTMDLEFWIFFSLFCISL